MSEENTVPVSLEPVQMHVRFWPGPDKDLILWLESLADLPYGGKSEQIKATLRQGLKVEDGFSQEDLPAKSGACTDTWSPN